MTALTPTIVLERTNARIAAGERLLNHHHMIKTGYGLRHVQEHIDSGCVFCTGMTVDDFDAMEIPAWWREEYGDNA